MKPLRLVAILFIVVIVVLYCSQPSQPKTDLSNQYSIYLTGRVLDKDGKPMANVVAKLADKNLSDTTRADGYYNITEKKANGVAKTTTASVGDSLQILKAGQVITYLDIAKWIDTLPDVFIIQRDIYGSLSSTPTSFSRITATITGDSIPDSLAQVAVLGYIPATGNYSGFVYFVYTAQTLNYNVYVSVYNADTVLIGRSMTVNFPSTAGDISMPAFDPNNAMPSVYAGNDTTVSINDTIRLHATASDSFGKHIVKWEWNINNTGFRQTATGDTIVIAPADSNPNYVCVVRVTANDSNIMMDSMSVRVVGFTDITDTTIVTGVVDTNSPHFYLFTYFLNSNDQAGARLALSSDGIHWQLFNEGNPIMVPSVGSEHRQRDSYTYYDSTTKMFNMVWTTGWNGIDIGYAYSRDLKVWSPQHDLLLGAKISNCSCMWSPEIFRDDIKDSFMIYWSTDNGTNGKRAWYVLTKDFKTFTDPVKLFDPGYSEIDGDILKVADGKYYLFFKDERDPGTAGKVAKNIHYVYGPTPQGPWNVGPWDNVSPPITDPGCEGPCAIKIGNEYRVYFDPYSDFTSTYRMVSVTNLDTTISGTWPQGATLTTKAANFSYNHGHIIEIPRIYVMHLLYGRPIQ